MHNLLMRAAPHGEIKIQKAENVFEIGL